MSKSDDTHGPSFEFNSAVFLPVPLKIFDFCVGPDQVVVPRQDHPHGMFGHSVAIAVRGIENGYISLCREGLVDDFHATAQAGDKFQVGCLVKKPGSGMEIRSEEHTS